VDDHKGFFEHSWPSPTFWIKARSSPNWKKLRMPNLHLTKDQVRSLTTFLFGQPGKSSPGELSIPSSGLSSRYSGRLVGGQEVQLHGLPPTHPRPETSLMAMTRYQEADGQEQLPPKLLTEGARVNPEWLLAIPEESGAQRQRGQSQRRALLLASAHAHLLVLRKRAGLEVPGFLPAM